MTNSELTKATAKTFIQLALGITDFLASPPAGTPALVLDDLSVLKAQSDSIVNTLAAKAIENALADLDEPARKIKKVTEDLNKAINAIKSRDKAFKTIAKFVEIASGIAGGIQSRDFSSIGKNLEKFKTSFGQNN